MGNCKNYNNKMAAWLTRRKLFFSCFLDTHVTQCYMRRNFSQDKNLSNSLAYKKSRYNAMIDKAKERTDYSSNQERFSAAIDDYHRKERLRLGHMEFIKLALMRLEEFGLQKDLLSYTRLIDVFPRGKFNPKNIFDAFWPKNYPQIDLAP